MAEPTQFVGAGPVGVIVKVTVTGALVVLVNATPAILVPEPLAAIPVTFAVLSLVQAKVVPATELLVLKAILVKLPALHIVWLPLVAVATGIAFTVTLTLLEAEQPVAVIVSVKVYVVLVVGLAVGLDTVELLRAVLGDQLYVCPTVVVAPNTVLAPLQMLTSAPALSDGKGFTVASTVNAEPAQVLAVGVTVYLLTPPAALVKVCAIVVPHSEAQLAAPVIVPDTAA